LLGTT